MPRKSFLGVMPPDRGSGALERRLGAFRGMANTCSGDGNSFQNRPKHLFANTCSLSPMELVIMI